MATNSLALSPTCCHTAGTTHTCATVIAVVVGLRLLLLTVAASGMPSVMTGRSYPCVLSHLAVIATALSVRGRFVLLVSNTE